jgi:hypothetical protein
MIGCDTCDSWVHFACDARAAELEGTDGAETYYCPSCRTNVEYDQKLEELTTLEMNLRDHKPKSPRQPIDLFWGEAQR